MTKVGDRVELVSTDDEYTRRRPGDLGTVAYIDSMGTLHVQWDDGGVLGLVPGHDRWRTILDDRPDPVVTCPACGSRERGVRYLVDGRSCIGSFHAPRQI